MITKLPLGTGSSAASRDRIDRSLLWVLVLGVVPVVVLALAALSLHSVSGPKRALPLLMSSWGSETSCISSVRAHEYTLAIGPDDNDSYPYYLYVDEVPEDYLESAVSSQRADRAAAIVAPGLHLHARDFAWARNTMIEIDTFDQPRAEPGTALTYQKAGWVEDNGALATLYTRSPRPLPEILNVIEGLHRVPRTAFERRLCADMRPDRPSVPRLVGPDTNVKLTATDWILEDVGTIGSVSMHTYDTAQGTAEAIVASTPASARSEPVTIRGHAGWKIFDNSDNSCGSLIWAEAGAVISVQSCFGPTQIAALDQLHVATPEEWLRLVFDTLDP